MPLLNHFVPPLQIECPWEGFHSAWATMIAQALNRLLPPGFRAIPQASRGPRVEIDVATVEMAHSNSAAPPIQWSPEEPTWSAELTWPTRDLFEVRVFENLNGPRLVGAIELVSPANKDRPSTRQAFAGKCAGYLRLGVGLVVVDVVTIRQQDLHQHLLDLLELEGAAPAPLAPLYAVAYRTVADESTRLDVWPHSLTLGEPLPTLPLWLSPELVVPVDLEVSYVAACDLLRIGTTGWPSVGG